eukprot:1193942-Prorocentrum_minimum.AAC.1
MSVEGRQGLRRQEPRLGLETHGGGRGGPERRSIQTDATTQHEMCGIFNFRTRLNKETKIGYVEVKTQPTCRLFPPNQIVRGQVYTFSEAPITEGEREYTHSRHQSQKGRENIPIAGTKGRWRPPSVKATGDLTFCFKSPEYRAPSPPCTVDFASRTAYKRVACGH